MGHWTSSCTSQRCQSLCSSPDQHSGCCFDHNAHASAIAGVFRVPIHFKFRLRPPGQAGALTSRSEIPWCRAGVFRSLLFFLGGHVLSCFTCFIASSLGCLLGWSRNISGVIPCFRFLGVPFPPLSRRWRRRRHKRIRGVGSQTASRRGAKPRLSAPVFKACPQRFRSFYGVLTRFYAPLTPRPRPTLLQAVGIFVAAALICTLLEVFEVRSCRWIFSFPLLLGALGLCLCVCVCVGSFSCSCFSGLRGCSSCSRDPWPVASGCPWPSNPGPSALNSVQASKGVTIPLPLSQVEVFAVSCDATPSQLPSLSVVSDSGVSLPSVSPAVAANSYVSASPPPQPLLARHSRFCSFSRPGSAVRRRSSQARSARPAPRRSRSPPQVSALALSGQSPGPPPSRSSTRLFCPVPTCPDSFLLTGGRPSAPRAPTLTPTSRDRSPATSPWTGFEDMVSAPARSASVFSVCVSMAAAPLVSWHFPIVVTAPPVLLALWRRVLLACGRFSPATGVCVLRSQRVLGTPGQDA